MITTFLSLAHQRKNKQTNKNSVQISPYMNLTQTTGQTLRGQKPKGRKNQPSSRKEFNFSEDLEKETSNRVSKKKKKKERKKERNNNEKSEKYYTNEGKKN